MSDNSSLHKQTNSLLADRTAQLKRDFKLSYSPESRRQIIDDFASSDSSSNEHQLLQSSSSSHQILWKAAQPYRQTSSTSLANNQLSEKKHEIRSILRVRSRTMLSSDSANKVQVHDIERKLSSVSIAARSKFYQTSSSADSRFKAKNLFQCQPQIYSNISNSTKRTASEMYDTGAIYNLCPSKQSIIRQTEVAVSKNSPRECLLKDTSIRYHYLNSKQEFESQKLIQSNYLPSNNRCSKVRQQAGQSSAPKKTADTSRNPGPPPTQPTSSSGGCCGNAGGPPATCSACCSTPVRRNENSFNPQFHSTMQRPQSSMCDKSESRKGAMKQDRSSKKDCDNPSCTLWKQNKDFDVTTAIGPQETSQCSSEPCDSHCKDRQTTQNDTTTSLKCRLPPKDWQKFLFDNFVRDNYCPGIIQDTIDGVTNFNAIMINTMREKIGALPRDPGPYEPWTLIEAFALRIDHERLQVKHYSADGNKDPTADIDAHFHSQTPTRLNRAISHLLKAERLHEVNSPPPKDLFDFTVNRAETLLPNKNVKLVLLTASTTPKKNGK